MLLQKVDDKVYVRDKIDLMYRQANIAIPSNRLGLAKGIGLVGFDICLLMFSLQILSSIFPCFF